MNNLLFPKRHYNLFKIKKSKNLVVAALATLCLGFGMNYSYADSITPTLGEESIYVITKGDSENYSFKTTEGNEVNFWNIGLNASNIGQTHGSYFSTYADGAEGNFDVIIPNSSQPLKLYYKYIMPAGYENATSGNPSISSSVQNKLFTGAGRAINNSAQTSNDIIADFIGNYYSVSGYAHGGAIYNSGRLGNVIGDFINNYSKGSEGHGGAIDVWATGASIGNITGDFIGNHAEGNYGGGGAIILVGTDTQVGNINGNFINNYLKINNTDGYGGAIRNAIKAKNITGDFINNYITKGSSSSGSVLGGAIANTANSKIELLKGDFINNHVVSSQYSGLVLGGAVYNSGDAQIEGNFIGNYVQSGATSTYGGAIYNGNYSGSSIIYSSNATMTLRGNTFTGNYTNVSGTKKTNSIYNAGIINIASGATVTINDGWESIDTSSGTGRLVMASGSTLNMNIGNGVIQQDNLGIVTNAGTINATIDIDLSNTNSPNSDTITVSSVSQAGKINLTSLNLKGNFDNYKNKTYTRRILINKTTNNNLQLQLALEEATGGEYILQRGEKVAQSDEFSGASSWTSTFESYNLSTDIVGTIALASSNSSKVGTTNDSIQFTATRTAQNKSDILPNDTLKIVNQSTLPTRSFNAESTGETYNVTDNLGTTAAGTINIDGNPGTTGTNGTIDLKGYTGFELSNNTTLNLTQVNLKDSTNSSATLIDVSNSNAKVNLTDSSVTGSIIGTTVFDITTSGTSSLNGVITNAHISNSGNLVNNALVTGSVVNTAGNFENNGVITGDVNVNSGNFENNAVITGDVSNNGILTSAVSNLGGSIANTNRLNLSGTLNKAISGSGTTYVNGTLILDSDSSVTNVNVNGGTLTINDGAMVSGILDAGNGTIVSSPNSATNISVGSLTGSGNLELDIDYSGASVVMDTLTTTNNGTGKLTITDLNEIGTRKDFSIQVLNGGGDSLTLALDETIVSDFSDVDIDTVYAYDPVTNPAIWTDVFNTTKTVTTITRNLYVEDDNRTLTYGITDTNVDVTVTKTGDTLALVNQSSLSTRNFNASTEGETYIAEADIGKSGLGIMTINGNPDPCAYEDSESVVRGTIDLAAVYSGFELDKATTLNINDVKITNAKSGTDVINSSSTDSIIILKNSELDGSVANAGNLSLENSKITGLVTNTGVLNLNEGSKLSSALLGSGTTNINADYNLDHVISGNNIVLDNDAELKISSAGMLSGANSFTINSGSLNLQNDIVNNTNLGNLVLNSDMNLKIDGDFENKQIDTITVNSIISNGNYINISDVNILSPITEKQFSISPIGEIGDLNVKTSLSNSIAYSAGDIAMTPIYKYHVDYDRDNGMLNFSRFGGDSYDDFNPSVVSSSVAAQAGVQSTINNTMNYAFQQLDTFTKFPSAARFIVMNANRYAINDVHNSGASTDFNQNMTLRHSDENAGIWIRPYTVFENIPLQNGPKVNAISYGTLVGFDTNFHYLKRGWYGVTSGYIGYNGAQLNYNGVDTSLNGGLLGATETFYKNNFWTAITATVGGSFAESHSMYGRDDITSLMAGVGSKTGYNFEFKEGKVILQPIMFLNYSFINTFDYTNGAGIKIHSNPLHNLQINPSLRIIGNIKDWQPYASVGMVWNVMDMTNTSANGVKLPQMHVRPYVQYGVGIQKTFGERVTGFVQAMLHNGGRNGIALTGGFRWSLGKGPDVKEKVKNQSVTKTAKTETKVIKISDKNSKKPNKIWNDKSSANVSEKRLLQQSFNKNVQKAEKLTKLQLFFAKMNGESF